LITVFIPELYDDAANILILGLFSNNVDS